MERKHLFVAVFVVLSFVGCASWWANTPNHVIDIAKIVTCVMTEIDKVPAPPPQDIALKCGLENADAVLDLVKAQKAAEARHVKPAASSSPLPPPCGSASAVVPAPAPAAVSAPLASAPVATPIPTTTASAGVKPVVTASASAKPAASTKPATTGSAKP